MYSEDRPAKKTKMDDKNHESANGNVEQPSATVVTQQHAAPTAPADVPAYTYAHTWPGYGVRMTSFLCQFTEYTSDVMFNYIVEQPRSELLGVF